MRNRPNPNDPNADKFNFDQHARDLDAQNLFAPPDTPPGIGLRQFLDRETRLKAASSGSFESCATEILAPGIYIRGGQDGYELVVYRGRQAFDIYSGEREDLIQLAESLQKGK